MNSKINPKKENANKGFHYTVSDAQIEAYSKFSLIEKLAWLENTNKFIYMFQTPEERVKMLEIRNEET